MRRIVCWLCLLVTVMLLTIGCEKKVRKANTLKIEKASWLLGRWENNSPGGNLSESWKKVNDSTFFGESHFVINSDTVFAETVQLEDRGGSLFYIVTVAGQNDEKPVSFKLTASTAELVFENPAHDFPNKIAYKQVGTDSLVATISGIKDGEEKQEIFKMKAAAK